MPQEKTCKNGGFHGNPPLFERMLLLRKTRFANRKFSSDQLDQVVVTTELRLDEACTKLVAAKPNCNVRDRSIAGAAALIEQQIARDEVFLTINGFPFFYLSIIARTVTADFHPAERSA